MKKMKLGIFTILLLIGIFAIIFSCKKEDNEVIESNAKKMSLKEINDYKPPRDQIADIYYTFKDEISMFQENAILKDSILTIEDKPLNEAIWQLETAVNNDFGFQYPEYVLESSEYVFELTNVGVAPDSTPIVSGADVLARYSEIENIINQRAQNNDFFWDNTLEVISITPQTSTFQMNGSWGYIIGGVLPIGVMPEPFGPGIGMPACKECSGYYIGADNEFEKKIRLSNVIQAAPGYIIEFSYSHYKSPISPGCWGRIWGGWTCADWLDYPELDEWLMSTKEVIDENNPSGLNGYFLGHILIEGFAQTVSYPYARHLVSFYVFQAVLVGIPE